jgi:hypothetical protein
MHTPASAVQSVAVEHMGPASHEAPLLELLDELLEELDELLDDEEDVEVEALPPVPTGAE